MAEETVKAVQVKLVLLGEAAVGKSSLVSRFVQNDFNENTSPTIGAAFLTQKCRLENRTVKFEIWDTAGQERFHSLAPMYYRNAQAAVVVYDITKAASLEKAKSWVKELQRQASPNIVIALVGNKLDLVSESDSHPSAVSAEAVGSEDATETPAEDSEEAEDKSDDDESSTPTKTKASSSTPAAASPSDQTSSLRQISTSEASQYASESKLLFTEASAKTGQGVQEIFELIAKTIPIEAAPATGATAGTAAGSAGQRGQRGQQREGVSLTEAQQKKGGCC